MNKPHNSLRLFRRLLCLAVGVFLLAACPPQRCQAGSTAMDNVDQTVVALSKFTRVESGQVGEGGESRAYRLYEQLRGRIAQLPIQDLMWLTANGTAASRVYSAFLTRSKDSKAGIHSVLELLDDDSPVEYQTGCEVLSSSVSEIGSAYTATGAFLDFQDKPDLKPIYLEELRQAAQFADQVGGESGRQAEFLIFRAAFKNAHSLKVNDLKSLQKNATAAGRLYAAMLLESSGKLSRAQAFAPLLNDNASVLYVSGCKAASYRVSAVARQFKQTGRFHNFALSSVQ
jgi:hypothetical protein